jgi:hypothetical protein
MQDAYFRSTSEIRCELRVISDEGKFDVIAENGVIDDTLTIAGDDASIEEIRGALLKVDKDLDIGPEGVTEMHAVLDSIEEDR